MMFMNSGVKDVLRLQIYD